MFVLVVGCLLSLGSQSISHISSDCAVWLPLVFHFNFPQKSPQCPFPFRIHPFELIISFFSLFFWEMVGSKPAPPLYFTPPLRQQVNGSNGNGRTHWGIGKLENKSKREDEEDKRSREKERGRSRENRWIKEKRKGTWKEGRREGLVTLEL